MSLSARPELHDIGTVPVAKLNERTGEGRNEPSRSWRFERDFMISVGRNDENEVPTDFDLGRRSPEIALTHTRSPDITIRLPENCDSFVMNGNLTCINHFACGPQAHANGAQVSTQACAPTLSGPEHRCPTRSGPFSIARTP